MIITRAQFQMFEEHAETDLVRRTADDLRAAHADATVKLPDGERALGDLPEGVLLGLVRAALARARAHGITETDAEQRFVERMFVVAPNFDEHPLVRRILAGAEGTPEERFAYVLECASKANWEGARRRYDARAWQRVP